MSREFLSQNRTVYGVCPKLSPLLPYAVDGKSSLSQKWIHKIQLTELSHTGGRGGNAEVKVVP